MPRACQLRGTEDNETERVYLAKVPKDRPGLVTTHIDGQQFRNKNRLLLYLLNPGPSPLP